MDSNKIEFFIASMASKFPAEKLMFVRQQLEKIDDNKFMSVQAVQYKDPTTLLIVSILIGGFGVDRFMLGQTGLGIAKLLTCGGLGIWSIVDWFLIMNLARENNFNKFMEASM